MTLAVEEDVPADPRDVGLLRAPAVVPGAGSLAEALQQAGLRSAGQEGLAHGEREYTPLSDRVPDRRDG